MREDANKLVTSVFGWLVCLATALFPLSPQFFTIPILAAYLLWFLDFKRNVKLLSIPPVKIFLLLFVSYYSLSILGLIHSYNLREAGKELEITVSILLLPPLILANRLDHAWLTRILRSFVFSIFLISLYCIIRAALGAHNAGHGLTEFITNYQYQTSYFTDFVGIHPTYFSLFLSMSIFLLFIELDNKFSALNFIRVSGIIFLCLINFKVLSRGGLIGFVAVLIFSVIYYTLINQWRPLRFALVISTFGIIGYALFHTVPNFRYRFTDQMINLDKIWSGYDSNNSTSLHFKSWQCALQSLNGVNLLIGHGTGSEVSVLTDCYQKNGYTEMSLKKLNAHNLFLSLLLKYGMLGFVFFFALIFTITWHAVKNKQNIYLAFLCLFFIVSMFESTLNVYRGVVFFSLFSSLFFKKMCLQDKL